MYVWGYALVGIVLAVLIRSIVGSIVAFFVLPTIEGILSPILKQNAQYLPFRSLDSIPAPGSPDSIAASAPSLDNVAALGVFAVYLAVFGTVAVVLFLKRDATA